MHRRSIIGGLLALPFAGSAAPAEVSHEAALLAAYKAEFVAAWSAMAREALTVPELWFAFSEVAYRALDQIADRALGLAADGVFDAVFDASIRRA